VRADSALWLLGLDVSDAFRQVPLERAEKQIVTGPPLPGLWQQVSAHYLRQVCSIPWMHHRSGRT
jgi:hypothetical protein